MFETEFILVLWDHQFPSELIEYACLSCQNLLKLHILLALVLYTIQEQAKCAILTNFIIKSIQFCFYFIEMVICKTRFLTKIVIFQS